MLVLGAIYDKIEPPHEKTNKMTCAASEGSDQHGHPPSLMSDFAVRMKKPWVLSYPLSAQRRLWSDWADAQADLSPRWAQWSFCWFCHAAAQMSRSQYFYHLERNEIRHCRKQLAPHQPVEFLYLDFGVQFSAKQGGQKVQLSAKHGGPRN